MNWKDIEGYLHKKRGEHLEVFKTLVAQPSISATGEGVEDCVRLLQSIMEKRGISTRILATPGLPLLHGEAGSANGHAPRVLFYGHYDVQPVEPLGDWVTPPFQPSERDGRLYGRGTGDNKGQLLAHILATAAYIELFGKAPVHLGFILDGEEESGSPHLPQVVSEKKDLFQADLVYTSDGPMPADGTPAIYFGVRGILNFEVRLTSGERDNHSGNAGGVIPNAAWEMLKLLQRLKDEQGRITIPGFYDDIMEFAEDQFLIENLPFDSQAMSKVYGANVTTEEKEVFYRRLMLEPVLNINGIQSGYGGEGTKTIIPCEAVAKLDIRLVANQKPESILHSLETYLQSINPGVQVLPQGWMAPSRTPPTTPLLAPVKKALEKSFHREPRLFPATGGSLPDYVWTRLLQKPSLIIPYANADEANHSPNENMDIEYFFRGIQASAAVLFELAQGN